MYLVLPEAFFPLPFWLVVAKAVPWEGTGATSNFGARLGIPIFGSDFWDPHRKQNSGSVSDSEDSGRRNFNQIPLLKNREIGIPIPKFGILKKINVGI